MLDDAQLLLNLITDYNMVMALPKDIPTLHTQRMKNWSRPDNVFCSPNAEDHVMGCDVMPRYRGPCTDHIPIATVLDIPIVKVVPDPVQNFWMTDWKAFEETLLIKITENLPPAVPLANNEEFQTAAEALT
ncbi:hypothetical protein Hypma_010539 [Hypsizygus marmoreus]|uniref:Endonuclease/exonuclease/phosphatase domain-containing protein n=1 Tax=Hypsizygus marmoreus TaxID=39966 RepID=A0A369JJD3_HYPMA|nr:hypothetical protein Hypma_010539 [Hypsizygus marmoreus]